MTWVCEIRMGSGYARRKTAREYSSCGATECLRVMGLEIWLL